MKPFIVLWLIVLILHPIVAMAQSKSIGMVKVSKGDTSIVRDDKHVRGKIGLSVFQNDVLETGKDGSLGVTFKDNTRVSLGPNSQLSLKEFSFNPKEKEYSFISEIARGTLVYISGMMSKLSPESVSVKTPSATIGIRGTRFLIRIDDELQNDMATDSGAGVEP